MTKENDTSLDMAINLISRQLVETEGLLAKYQNGLKVNLNSITNNLRLNLIELSIAKSAIEFARGTKPDFIKQLIKETKIHG